MAHLRLDAVTRRFGSDRPAVDRLSLAVERGTFLALLGPSGCGKTTTLRMIAGFEAPESGSIMLGDRVLAGPRRVVPPEERNMAMVFQSHALWPHMSVSENIGYPLKVRGVSGQASEAKIARALDTVQLGPFRDRRLADLSGGQRQRVALARCLVTEPEMILFDEPLASLDRHLKASLEQAFRDFHRLTGATIVYVTHDQAEAMSLASRVAVMSEGRLAQLGTPEAVYRMPENATVAGLIGAGAIIALSLPDGAGRELDRDVLHAALSGKTSDAPAEILVRPEDVLADPEGLPFAVAGCVFRGERYALALEHTSGARLSAWSQAAVAPGATLRMSVTRGWKLAG